MMIQPLRKACQIKHTLTQRREAHDGQGSLPDGGTGCDICGPDGCMMQNDPASAGRKLVSVKAVLYGQTTIDSMNVKQNPGSSRYR